MTGSVPYYGGRFTPGAGVRRGAPAASAGPASRRAAAGPASRPSAAAPDPSRRHTVEALQHLLDTGVLTQEEFDELRARVER